MSQTDLAKRMIALADGGHPRGADLRDLARKFDDAAVGYYSEPQTVDARRFLGHWARAHKLYEVCAPRPESDTRGGE